jgi:hypothetical protein
MSTTVTPAKTQTSTPTKPARPPVSSKNSIFLNILMLILYDRSDFKGIEMNAFLSRQVELKAQIIEKLSYDFRN